MDIHEHFLMSRGCLEQYKHPVSPRFICVQAARGVLPSKFCEHSSEVPLGREEYITEFQCTSLSNKTQEDAAPCQETPLGSSIDLVRVGSTSPAYNFTWRYLKYQGSMSNRRHRMLGLRDVTRVLPHIKCTLDCAYRLDTHHVFISLTVATESATPPYRAHSRHRRRRPCLGPTLRDCTESVSIIVVRWHVCKLRLYLGVNMAK